MPNQDRTLPDIAFRVLREEIMSGEIQPGSRLRLHELASRLDMSVIPVREALMRLTNEGLVEQVPHKGARVKPVSMDDLEDLYRVRIRLERWAIEEATRRMEPADHDRALSILDAYRAAHARGDAEEGWRLHASFHFALYEMSDSPWLVRTIRPLWAAAERYQRLSLRGRGPLDARYAEHKKILDACASKNPEAAAFALDEHLRRSLESIQAVVDVDGQADAG